MELEYKIYKDTDDFILNFNDKCYLLFSDKIHFTDSINLRFKEKPKKHKILYFLEKSEKFEYGYKIKNDLKLLVENKININKNDFKQLPKNTRNKLKECMTF